MKRTLRSHPAIPRIAWVVLLLSAHLSAQLTNETAPQSGSTKIVVEADAVLIPVVVRDSKGHSVGNLKKEDFQVFDKNYEQSRDSVLRRERVFRALNRAPIRHPVDLVATTYRPMLPNLHKQCRSGSLSLSSTICI